MKKKIISATNKVKGAMSTVTGKMVAGVTALAAAAGISTPAWCDINGNTSLQNFLKILFNVTLFGGIILAVAGAAMLLKTIISITSGDQPQPGALGKGIGMLLGGIVLIALKAIIKAIIGVDPTTLNFLDAT